MEHNNQLLGFYIFRIYLKHVILFSFGNCCKHNPCNWNIVCWRRILHEKNEIPYILPHSDNVDN